jgi:hypothetical protein
MAGSKIPPIDKPPWPFWTSQPFCEKLEPAPYKILFLELDLELEASQRKTVTIY